MPVVMLSDYLEPDLVFGRGEFDASDKRDLLMSLAARASDKVPSLTPENVFKKLMEREAEHPTALGGGLAIPHALLEGMDRPVLGVVVLAEPLNFGAPDNAPVDLVVLILSPASQQPLHLRILARLARLMVHDDMAERLRAAKDRQEVLHIMVEEDKSHVY